VHHADPHPGPRGRWLREQLVGVFVALLIVAGLTASLAAAFLWLPIEHITIVYLIPVILTALRWGAIPALVAGVSGIAAAAFFFYAPYYDFRVHSPAQIADIVLFITVAAITGRVAIAVRQAKIRAQAEGLRDALSGRRARVRRGQEDIRAFLPQPAPRRCNSRVRPRSLDCARVGRSLRRACSSV
jgi:K+-sensing histidine kinase KdpD